MKQTLLLFTVVFSLSFSMAQTSAIKGKVIDEEGNPIFNAAIVVEGEGKGAYTNMNGDYEVAGLTPGEYTVSFRSSEFKNKQETVTLGAGEILVLDVIMSTSQDLEEVMVIGYGTMRTSDLTGAATVIKEDKFFKGNVGTPEQLIMGKAAGLRVNTNDGSPGGGSTIRLRGGTSLNASNDPLIVVDGVPLDNGGIAGSPNALSLINPNDIESFVILRDASATAIYGSRGANGVILITTKKGTKKNKLNVNVQSIHNVMTVARYADVLSADEFRELVTTNGTPAQAALLGEANTDWQREVFRTAYTADNNVSVTGGINNLPYRLSFGNRYENGLLQNDRFIRNSLALSLTPQFLDGDLQIQFNNRLAHTSNVFADRGALGAAYFDPTQPVFVDSEDFGGYFEWLENNGAPNQLSPRNPVGLINQRDDRSSVLRYIGNLKATYRLPFWREVRTTVNVGTDRAESSGSVTTAASSAAGFFSQGSFNEYFQRRGNQLFEAFVNYNNGENDSRHLIDFTGGWTAQDWFTISPNLPIFNEAQDSIIQPAAANPFDTRNALLSYFGRGIYTFDDRYVLNLSVRRDGSSRFSPETRWGTFPSASAAWLISRENFMKDLKWMSMMKVRAGWGVTGQQDGIGDYAYIPNYFPGSETAQYGFGGVFYPVLRPDGFDANLRWETTSSINIGVDFGFFKDRINGSIDIYSRDTRDLLAVVPVPAGSNFTNQILTNVGAMRNEGIEFMVNAAVISKKDTRLDVSGNAAYNINSVLQLAQIEDPNSPGVLVGGIAGGIGNTIQVHQIGSPTFSFFVYEQQYDADGMPIEVGAPNPAGGTYTELDAFVDRNGDGVINIEDRYVLGQAAPLWFLGLSFDYSYKKWFASLGVRAELGGYIYNNIHSNNGTFMGINGTQGFLNNLTDLYFEEEFQTTTERQLLSDHYVERADFLRLDYISVGYDFGRLKAFKERVTFRAALTVNNVAVLTQYKGLDPEIVGGIDNNIYPRPRVFSLNLSFGF